MAKSVDDVLEFWLDTIGPDGWYNPPAGLDGDIRARFADTWEQAMDGAGGLWLTDARGALAYLILMDQFPRNMFRGTEKSFASDANARAAAKMAIDKGWDMDTPAPGRQFFYMPLEHSENMVDQDRAVALMRDRLADMPDMLLHARAHRAIIAKFGRFPFRNKALGRDTTPDEAAFLDAGGYRAALGWVRKPD